MPTKRELETENHALRQALISLHWMSRRYADGRSTVAPSTHNRAVRLMLDLGLPVNKSDGIIWARDGMGRDYDNLTDEQATEGTPAALGEDYGKV